MCSVMMFDYFCMINGGSLFLVFYLLFSYSEFENLLYSMFENFFEVSYDAFSSGKQKVNDLVE